MRNRCIKCVQHRVVVRTSDSTVIQCTRGNYHVNSGNLSIIFTHRQFDRIARLLKLALGTLSARKSEKPPKLVCGLALCLLCGQTLKFNCNRTAKQCLQLAKHHGFNLAGSSLRIVGYCAWCRNQNRYLD